MTAIRIAVLVVALLASMPASSQDSVPAGPDPWDGGDLEADLVIANGWNHARATGDFSELKLALRPHCLSEVSGSWSLVEGYIRNGGRKMTREQRYGLLEYCFALCPNSAAAWNLQVEMARERFNAWSPVERENAYWEAVATGHNCVEGFYEFSRIEAVLFGLWARCDGFGALAGACSGELDERHARPPGTMPYSQELSWVFFLRTGTPDDPVAQGTFAQRLASLEPSFLLWLIENNESVRYAVDTFTQGACGAQNQPALEDLARAVLRQCDLMLKATEPARETQRWLSRIWECTGYARYVVAKDPDYAVRGDEVMRGPDGDPGSPIR